MTYAIAQGIQVSLDGNTWYKLSDHNRQPIQTSYEVIENAQRMANGKMRKYVIANKFKVNLDWRDFPSLDANLVDYSSSAKGSAWIKAFYEANLFQPIHVKLIYAKESVPTQNNVPSDSSYTDSRLSSSTTFLAFMTSFKYDVEKRMVATNGTIGYDYTTVSIEFTEV